MEDHEDDDDLIIPSRRVPSTYVGSNCSDKKQFRVMSLNVQSMNNKFDAIRLLAETTGAPILALQETWGRNPTTEYSIKGYHRPEIITRKGEGMNLGGGVGLWVSKSLDFETIKVPWHERVCEMQAINIPGKNLIIVNVYRPFGDINIFFELLENALDHISNSFPKSDLIMVGDFNIDLIKSSTQANRLIELTLLHNCLQQVTLPIRIQGSTQTLIDHVFINTKQDCKTDVVMCDLSDHYACLLYTSPSPRDS